MTKIYKESYKMEKVRAILKNKSVYDFSNYLHLNQFTNNETVSKNLLRYLKHISARDSSDMLPSNSYKEVIFNLLNHGFIESEESEFKLLPISSDGLIKRMMDLEEVYCVTDFGNVELLLNEDSFYYYDGNMGIIKIDFSDISNYDLLSYQLV